MFQRLTTLLAILLIGFASSCDFNKKEKCIALDNTIAAINDSLLRYGAQWGDELNIAVNTLDFSGLPPIRQQMQDYIDRKIEFVKGMDNIGGSEKLLEAELEFLQAEREIITTKLAPFERFDDSVTMDVLSTTYADMQYSALKERDLLEKIHTLRDEYADKNGFPKAIE